MFKVNISTWLSKKPVTTSTRALVFGAALACSGTWVWAAPSSYQEAVLAHNPYVYYRFDEASGAAANDSSSNGFGGTYVNNPVLQQAGAGSGSDHGVKFTGTTSGPYMDSSAKDFGSYVGTSSLEFVFKTNTGFPTNAHQALFGTTDTGAREMVSLQLNSGVGSAITTNGVRLFLRDDNSRNVEATFVSSTLFDGNYHHLLITYDLSTNVVVYVDGTALSGVTVTSSDKTRVFASPGAAAAFDFNPAFGAENVRGTISNRSVITIDEAALYDTVLSATDAASHAAALLVPEPATLGMLSLAGTTLLMRHRRSRVG